MIFYNFFNFTLLFILFLLSCLTVVFCIFIAVLSWLRTFQLHAFAFECPSVSWPEYVFLNVFNLQPLCWMVFPFFFSFLFCMWCLWPINNSTNIHEFWIAFFIRLISDWKIWNQIFFFFDMIIDLALHKYESSMATTFHFYSDAVHKGIQPNLQAYGLANRSTTFLKSVCMPWKFLKSVLCERLKPTASLLIRPYQCVLIRNKSTIFEIFTLLQILEKKTMRMRPTFNIFLQSHHMYLRQLHSCLRSLATAT